MFSTELIFHFVCSDCRNWWSYAVSTEHSCAEEFAMEERELMCPFCGYKEKHQKKEV